MKYVAPLGLLALCAAAPLMASSFQLSLLAQGLAWTILGISVWLPLSLLNQPSFGHAAYFGIGAYAAGLSSTIWNIDNLFLVLLIAMVISAVIAAPIAVIAARLDHIGFLLITLATAEMLRALASRSKVLGGSDGLTGISRPSVGIPGVSLTSSTTFFYVALILTVVCVAVLWALKNSSVGASLVAIRQSESRMQALGYHVSGYKIFAFIVSAAVASVGGVLHAYLIRFASPEDMSPLVSARALIIVVLGAGVLLGVAVVGIVLTMAEDLISSQTTHWEIVIGSLYILVALAGGMIKPVRAFVRRIIGRGGSVPTQEVAAS